MAIGAFGDFVFAATDGAATPNALSRARQSRLVTHATVAGAPVVEFLGLDAETVRLSGVLSAEVCGDVDAVLDSLRALQDGKPHPLTRGSRYFGEFVVRSVTYSEDAWAGSELAVASWQIELVSTREGGNG